MEYLGLRTMERIGHSSIQVSPNLMRTNAFIIDNDGKLIAGTEDRGVCWTTYPTTSVENVNNLTNSYILFQNYPNPFNPVTKIESHVAS